MKRRWIIRIVVACLTLLVVASTIGGGAFWYYRHLTPSSPIDSLIRSFRPGKPLVAGPIKVTAGKVVRVDQFTLEYDDVNGTMVDPDGKILSMHARSMTYRFIAPDQIDITSLDFEMHGPGGNVLRGASFNLGPTTIPALKKKPRSAITPALALLVLLGGAGFAAVFWLVWRKARPKPRGFPVEPSQAP